MSTSKTPKPSSDLPATETIKGFKVTDFAMRCRDTQFSIGKDYTQRGKPVLCETGYHFCLIANNCFNYYGFSPTNRVFEVEAFGLTVHGDDKSATNGIRFLRELTWLEVLSIVNTGANNTGRMNSGNQNSGNRNSGNQNSGDQNSGNRNSGYLNSGNQNSGIFCTTTPKNIELFNRPSDWSLQDFLDSEAYYITQRLMLTEWRSWSGMSDAEKEQYPRAETAEGYTKSYDYKAAWATLWSRLDQREKGSITSLPNFDTAVFQEITGIAL